MSRVARWAIALGVLAILGYVVVGRSLPRRTDDVLTSPASIGDLRIVVSDKAELESAESVQVACEIEGGGKLVTILPEGTVVAKNTVVARFDTDVLQKGINEQEVKWETAVGKLKAARSELEVQKNKAESEIAKAELALTLARLDKEAYENGEYQAAWDKQKSALEIGKKELKEAEDGLDFSRGMVKKGFVPPEQLRSKELFVDGKRSGVKQAEADLMVLEKFTRRRKQTELEAKAKDAERDLVRTNKSQEAATDKAQTETVSAEKTADIEKKQLERLRTQLDKCELKAPSDGIVIYFKRPWDESSRIKPGAQLCFQQPIFNLPDLSKMKVKMKVHESVVKKVKVDLTATMKLDALSNQVLHGKVISVAALAQGDDWRGGGVKEYETYVSVDDLPKDAGLRPGMSADVKILIKVIPGALTVPIQGVTEIGGQHVCYVVNGGIVERREVTIGDGNEQLVQILGGLAEGEQVALDARLRASAELGLSDPGKKSNEKEKSSTSTSAAKVD
ncbi:MAG TPA: efflux RND transporter periplasmic adaptor subunit [Chloroflexota bacterium]|nr:efflux RND transporter periplasmic adaptor subunit [Chloroflexota bacterium]